MPATNWEYKIVLLTSLGDYTEAADNHAGTGHINDLGALGWELAQVLNWDAEAAQGWVVFRRELAPASGDLPPA
ncbi:MAG TPA: hypothetical protein VFM49_15345 [Chloroflexia bacterium]|jgi:hypothetical protein|nr:hypothetical protein [Chloroflexia bacterium]